MKEECQTCKVWLLHTVVCASSLNMRKPWDFLVQHVVQTWRREILSLEGHTIVRVTTKTWREERRSESTLRDGDEKCIVLFLIDLIVSYITGLCITEDKLIPLLFLFKLL